MNNIFILDMPKNWFMNFFRWLFAAIDWVVYFLIEVLFRVIFNLANFELIGIYESFEKRIYVVLGIFMLFKVTFSLITYLVNPDRISDKERGVGKLVTRIMMVLVMLISIPTFFSLLTEFQNKLLPVIPRVIIGTSNDLKSDDVSGISKNMALTMITGFAHLKEECVSMTDNRQDIGDFLETINVACEDNKKIYAYDYLPIVSTLVGAIMCYVIFSLCITVAIRAFKMIILRMIAPVPVISYIDPKSSKDGMFSTWLKTLFSTWGELFLLLGIIYFIVYIIDFMLSGDFWRGFFTGVSNPFDGVLLMAFLIVGLLMFAKQAPKFLMDALGIKSKGNFMRMLGMGATALGGIGSARAAFRARQEYDAENDRGNHTIRNLGASLFSGLGGVSAGGNALLSSDKPSLMTGFDALSKNNATMLSRIAAGSTLGGRLSSMGQMLITGETIADVNERRIKNLEAFNKALGAIGSRAKDEMVKQNWTHGDLGEFTLLDQNGNVMYDSNGNVRTIKGVNANYKSFMAAKNAAAAAGQEYFEFTAKEKDSNGNWVDTKHIISMKDANMQEGFLLKNNEDNYISESRNEFNQNGTRNSHYDSVLSSLVIDAEEKSMRITSGDATLDAAVNSYFDASGQFHVSSRDSVKKTQDAINMESTRVQRDNARHAANRRGSGNKGN